ncbi:MAG: hypothetical protein ACREMB_11330 [Candidatus Rokuibacteriota bacterium]
MKDHGSPLPERTPFERFTDAMKRIMATPKAEVEKRAREARKKRRPVKKR